MESAMKLERWMERKRKEKEQPLLQGDGFPEGQRGKYPRSKEDKEQEDEFPGLWAILICPEYTSRGHLCSGMDLGPRNNTKIPQQPRLLV